EVLLNDVLVNALASSITSLSFEGVTGSDSLTIDGINGTPIPAGGITFVGGDGADVNAANFIDQITIKGTTGADAVVFNGATITLNGATIIQTGAETITYIGQGGADAVSVKGSAGADAVA